MSKRQVAVGVPSAVLLMLAGCGSMTTTTTTTETTSAPSTSTPGETTSTPSGTTGGSSTSPTAPPASHLHSGEFCSPSKEKFYEANGFRCSPGPGGRERLHRQ